MRTCNTRFSRLMAEALALSAATDRPLEDIAAALAQLADAERALPPAPLPDGQLRRTADADVPEAQRLAIYAWIDEQMLHSPRPDAAAWAGMSLQMRYCHTTAAGMLFYDRLDAELDACGIPRMENGEPLPTVQRLRLAAANPPSGSALPAFALCLLYGFQGKYYDSPDMLQSFRMASYQLLTALERCEATDATPPQPQERPSRIVLRYLEPVLLILVPLVLTVGFGLFCAALLTSISPDFHA